jgi:hypothetical protein
VGFLFVLIKDWSYSDCLHFVICKSDMFGAGSSCEVFCEGASRLLVSLFVFYKGVDACRLGLF